METLKHLKRKIQLVIKKFKAHKVKKEMHK
jgi:hypothetical protein